jgi:1,4-alpha-glucan branching enzyme
MPKAERPQTFTRIFRWRLPAGQTQEPATVEVVGTFTKWQKVPLVRDETRHAWQATLHDVPCNRTHHYMLLVDGKPARDEKCDGLAIPRTPQEAQYQLMTPRGPRVLMLFAQTK